jgi:hypothetical protein
MFLFQFNYFYSRHYVQMAAAFCHFVSALVRLSRTTSLFHKLRHGFDRCPVWCVCCCDVPPLLRGSTGGAAAVQKRRGFALAAAAAAAAWLPCCDSLMSIESLKLPKALRQPNKKNPDSLSLFHP